MPKYYSIYLWNITDETAILEILKSKTGEKFISQQFKICKLTCNLVLFPNGKTQKENGSFILFLCIPRIPNEWEHITFNWSLKCLETQCQVNGIYSLDNANDASEPNMNALRWSDRILLLSELQKMHTLQSITIEVTINLLDIKEYKSDKYLYRFSHAHWHINEDLMQKFKESHWDLHWHINEELMQRFRDSHWGKRFSQSISISQLFSIGVYPLGFNEKWKGFMSLSLHLNHMPMTKVIDKIKIKFRFQCADIEYDKTRVKVYSMANQHRGIVDFCESKYLKLLQTMDFECTVDILNVYDCDGNEIGKIDAQKEIESKNDKIETEMENDSKNDKIETQITETEIENDKIETQIMETKETKSESIKAMKEALIEQKKKMDCELLKLEQWRSELEMERKEFEKKREWLISDEEKQYNINIDMNESYDKVMECAVKFWLKHTVRLEQYIDNFVVNGFDDMSVIQETMNISDLAQIGIKKLGHQKKIMMHIDKLKKTDSNQDPHMF